MRLSPIPGTAVIGLLGCALAALPLVAQQRVVRGAAVDPGVAIRLWLPAGMVEVHGWDHDSVEVRATPDSMTQLIAGGGRSAFKFAVERRDLKTTPMASAQVRMYVPRGARLWIKSTTAAVSADGLTGELDVIQVGGGIALRGVSGVITLESIDGPMSLTEVDGIVRIRGGSGAVTLSALTGTIDVSTVGGRVMMPNSATVPPGAPRFSGRVETVGGEIWLMSSLAPGDRLELVTHGGPIRLLTGDAPWPRVITTIPEAVIDPRLLNPSPAGGTITVRSFKGTLNAVVRSGI